MAKWQPESETVVGKNEHVGRRLFDEPTLAGFRGAKPSNRLTLRHFEETRDREFSLDRLGRSGVDGRVVGYLLPRATAQGKKYRPEKTFDGWAVVKAQTLTNPPKGERFPVTPSPLLGSSEGLESNVYHAHATLPEFDAPDKSYYTALHLQFLFETYGSIHSAAPSTNARLDVSTEAPSDLRKGWKEILLSFLNKLSRWAEGWR